MSEFLAKAFCLYFVVVGLALFFNSRAWPGVYREYFENRALLILAGIFALVLGILLILVHNIWVMDWPLIITLLSWWAFIKGALILFIPDRLVDYSRRMTTESALRTAGLVMTLLGLVMGYFGFLAS